MALGRFDGRSAEFRALLGRTREIVVLAAVIGGLTGLGVAAFDSITADALFARVTSAPVGLEAAAPILGLLGAAAAMRASTGFPRSLVESEDVERATTTVRAALGEPAFTIAWEAGQALTLEQVIAEALN